MFSFRDPARRSRLYDYLYPIFAAPVFPDDDLTRTSRLLNFVLHIFLLSGLFTVLLLGALGENRWLLVSIATTLIGITILVRGLLVRGLVQQGAMLWLITLWLLLLGSTLGSGNSIMIVSISSFQIVTLVIAGLLLEERRAVLFTLLVVLANLALALAEYYGIRTPNYPRNTMVAWTTQAIAIAAIVTLLLLARNMIRAALTQARHELAERLRAEQQLRGSEDQLRMALEAGRLGTWSYNIRANRVTWSERMQLLYGMEEGALNFEHIYAEDRARVAAAFSELISGRREGLAIAYRMIALDGEVRGVESWAQLARDNKGAPARISSIVLDMTERKEAEYSLRQYAARLEILHAIDQATRSAPQLPQAIAAAAAEQLRRLIGCTRVSVSLFDLGQQISYLVATSTTRPMPPYAGASAPLADYGLEIVAMLQQGQSHYVEDVAVSPDSSSITQRLYDEQQLRSWLYLPMFYQEELIGALNLASIEPAHFNQTQSEIAQEVANQLAIAVQQGRLFEAIQAMNINLERRVQERTRELEALNGELESFSYSVSHDLRAPLRIVRGYAQATLDDFGDQLSEEGRTYLQTAIGGAERMNELIEALLALSRLGRKALRTRRISPAEHQAMVSRLVGELRAAEPERAVELSMAELPACIADPSLLQQVWANLLGNAFKYTRGREPARIEVGVEASPDGPIFFVRDNGTGFDMRYARNLFGVFQRFHSAEQFEGSGVGLATVQRIIQRHGGRVWAEAEPGKGATFRFTLGTDEARPDPELQEVPERPG